MPFRVHAVVPAALAVLAMSVAAAQPCDLTVEPGLFGIPGVDRFVAAAYTWDDGSGDALYVGGRFTVAGTIESRGIARWDGSAWSTVGDGPPDNDVDCLVSFESEAHQYLYAGGSFTSIGGVPAAHIARWDGSSWSPLGDGLDGPVYAIAEFDDGSGPALYAVGRFDSIDGVNSVLAARYRPGSGWERIGDGLVKQGSTTTLDAAVLFDDGDGEALYIAGSPFRPSGQSGFASVCRWDGAEWTKIGQDVGGRVTDLHVWDDGTGRALYMSGTATPGINYLARLEDGQWEIYEGGVAGPAVPPSNFPSVFGLSEYEGDLVVCGNYMTTGDGQQCEGIAIITSCAAGCVADWNDDGSVDTRDFIAFLGDWSAGDPDADLNGDGDVNTQDFIAFLNLWSAGC